jgi:hypothetical protein
MDNHYFARMAIVAFASAIFDVMGASFTHESHFEPKFVHSHFSDRLSLEKEGRTFRDCAGKRIEKGRITDISRTSGHYQPTSKQLRQFLHRLTQLGVPDTYRVRDEASTAAST